MEIGGLAREDLGQGAVPRPTPIGSPIRDRGERGTSGARAPPIPKVGPGKGFSGVPRGIGTEGFGVSLSIYPDR